MKFERKIFTKTAFILNNIYKIYIQLPQSQSNLFVNGDIGSRHAYHFFSSLYFVLSSWKRMDIASAIIIQAKFLLCFRASSNIISIEK